MQKNRKRKTLQELTIKDNFMFGAVMLEEENCRLLNIRHCASEAVIIIARWIWNFF